MPYKNTDTLPDQNLIPPDPPDLYTCEICKRRKVDREMYSSGLCFNCLDTAYRYFEVLDNETQKDIIALALQKGIKIE